MILGASTQSVVDRLKKERDRFVAFAFASADILMELDQDGKIMYADGATQKLLDYTSADLSGQEFLKILHDDDKDIGQHLLSADARARVDNVAIRIKTRKGGVFPLIMSGYKISELQGHFYLTFSTFRHDLSLSDVSRRDLRTGLLRKGEFSLHVNKQIILSRYSQQKTFLSVLTLDELKNVAKASREEDEIFRSISDIIKTISLNGDSAGLITDNSIGFIHSNPDYAATIEPSTKDIVKQVSGGNASVKSRLVTISLEIEQDITEEDTVQAILYTFNKFNDSKAKVDYRSLSDCYQEMVGETVRKIAEFKRIMNEGLFDLAFQPIVEVATGVVSHFEVLTRLKGPTSFPNPFAFIEFGESMGLISEYDLKVVARTLAILRQYKHAGYKPSICINLSGNSLSNQMFLDSLYELLLTEQDLCNQLVFEITESARVGSIKMVNDYFQKLRQFGVKCSIDDFGTGEATFEYLRNLLVDYVKIDGSYISAEALSTEHGRQLLRALSRLCTDVGVEVIGERVEDKASSDMLHEYGIRYGQGYYYAKPTIDTEVLKTARLDLEGCEVTKMSDYKK
jgi:PAS domain S-box-containing protein